MSVTIVATILGEQGDQKAKFTLEYGNMDYKNVVMIEGKLVDFVKELHQVGVDQVPVEKK